MIQIDCNNEIEQRFKDFCSQHAGENKTAGLNVLLDYYDILLSVLQLSDEKFKLSELLTKKNEAEQTKQLKTFGGESK